MATMPPERCLPGTKVSLHRLPSVQREGRAGCGSVSSADVEPAALNQETVEM